MMKYRNKELIKVTSPTIIRYLLATRDPLFYRFRENSRYGNLRYRNLRRLVPTQYAGTPLSDQIWKDKLKQMEWYTYSPLPLILVEDDIGES